MRIFITVILSVLLLNLSETLAQAQINNESKQESPELILLNKTESFFDAQEIIKKINWNEYESLQEIDKEFASINKEIVELREKYQNTSESEKENIRISLMVLEDKLDRSEYLFHTTSKEIAEKKLQQAGFDTEEIDKYANNLNYDFKYQETHDKVMIDRFNEILSYNGDIIPGLDATKFKKVLKYYVELNVMKAKLNQDYETNIFGTSYKIKESEKEEIKKRLENRYLELINSGELTEKQYAQMEFAISKSYTLSVMTRALAQKKYTLKFQDDQ